MGKPVGQILVEDVYNAINNQTQRYVEQLVNSFQVFYRNIETFSEHLGVSLDDAFLGYQRFIDFLKRR